MKIIFSLALLIFLQAIAIAKIPHDIDIFMYNLASTKQKGLPIKSDVATIISIGYFKGVYSITEKYNSISLENIRNKTNNFGELVIENEKYLCEFFNVVINEGVSIDYILLGKDGRFIIEVRVSKSRC